MLTKKERRVLCRARDLIASKKEGMICLALFSAAATDPALDRAATRLQGYISDALGAHSTLGGWQYAHGIHDRGEFEADQLRADRIAWIDWMLVGDDDGRA